MACRKEHHVSCPSTWVMFPRDALCTDGSALLQSGEFRFGKCDWCGQASMGCIVSWWWGSSDGQSSMVMRRRLGVQCPCGPLSFCLIRVHRLFPLWATCPQKCISGRGGRMYTEFGWISADQSCLETQPSGSPWWLMRSRGSIQNTPSYDHLVQLPLRFTSLKNASPDETVPDRAVAWGSALLASHCIENNHCMSLWII